MAMEPAVSSGLVGGGRGLRGRQGEGGRRGRSLSCEWRGVAEREDVSDRKRQASRSLTTMHALISKCTILIATYSMNKQLNRRAGVERRST
eukprot:762505-Hanusia_phi.AAC.3